MTWWAAYCEPRREAVAADALRDAGLSVFCPFERVTRRVKQPMRDAWHAQTRDEPLFPRYLFVDAPGVRVVRNARAVVDVVSSAGVPLAVPAVVVERLRACADDDGMVSRRDVSKRSFSFRGRVGDRFVFRTNSPLCGLFGQIADLARLDDSGVVKAFVDMLGARRLIDVRYEAVGAIASRPGEVVALAA